MQKISRACQDWPLGIEPKTSCCHHTKKLSKGKNSASEDWTQNAKYTTVQIFNHYTKKPLKDKNSASEDWT